MCEEYLRRMKKKRVREEKEESRRGGGRGELGVGGWVRWARCRGWEGSCSVDAVLSGRADERSTHSLCSAISPFRVCLLLTIFAPCARRKRRAEIVVLVNFAGSSDT